MEQIKETAFEWTSREKRANITSSEKNKIHRKVSASNRRKMINLIQSECCNYFSGECVATDTLCAQIQRAKIYNEKKTAALFACPLFLENVLPLDHDLQTTLLSPEGLRKCARCNTLFAAGSNRAKYCSSCVVLVRKKNKRECAQRKRAVM